MKPSIFVACLAAAFASPSFADPVVHEVNPFRAIEVQEGVRLNVSITDDIAVSVDAVEGDPTKLRVREFLPWIVFDRDTRWLIFPKWREDVLQVSVETPVLNGLKAFDNAQATFTGNADERLWIEAGTGGLITLSDVEVVELTLVAREGGTIVAEGRCDMLTIRNEGVSVDASGLTCASIVVNGEPEGVILPNGAVPVDAHPEPES